MNKTQKLEVIQQMYLDMHFIEMIQKACRMEDDKLKKCKKTFTL